SGQLSGVVDRADGQKLELVLRPAEHPDGLDRGYTDWIVRPDAAIDEFHRRFGHVRLEEGGRSRGGHCRVDRRLFVIRLQSRMMCGLVDIDAFENWMPCRNHQPGTALSELAAVEHAFQRAT